MKIDGTTQALEAGSAIFPFNPEGAMNIWKVRISILLVIILI